MHRKAQAFTLIELLVVISIISLLSSVVLSSINSAREKARIAAALRFESSLYKTIGAAPGGFWMFEENGASTAYDSSGNNSIGTLVGNTTWSSDTPTGKGYSILVDGIGDAVNIPAAAGTELSTVTDPGEGFTMATWYKSTGLPPNTYDGYLISRQGWHVGIFMLKASGFLRAIIWFEDNTSAQIQPSININDGKWHYYALSVDDTAKRFSLYMDGQLVGTNTYTKNLRPYTSSFRVGGAGSGYDAQGYFDNAMVFKAPYR